MSETTCGASVQAVGMRVAVLEKDGVPLPGAGNLYVTDALAKLDATPVYFKGADIQQPNAGGKLCVVYKVPDQLVRYDLALTVCSLDPELEHMVVGGELFKSGNVSVGGSAPKVGTKEAENGVSIELWSKHVVGGDIDSVYPYIHWVFPRTYWQPDKATWDNSPMERPFTGYTSENPRWFNGPANDWTFNSDRSWAWCFTQTVPVPTCGAQALVAS
jgi:hypothetical protein